jgi:hypothetical protein
MRKFYLSVGVVLNWRGITPLVMGNLCVVIVVFVLYGGLTWLYSEWGIWVLVSRVDWPLRGFALTIFTDEALSIFSEPVKLFIKVAINYVFRRSTSSSSRLL